MNKIDLIDFVVEEFDQEIWPRILDAKKAQSRDVLIRVLSETESVIEAKLLGAIFTVQEEFYDPAFLFGPEKTSFGQRGHGTEIAVQVKLNPYRADIAIIRHLGSSKVMMNIECDGHQFHDASPIMAARDKRRDRDLFSLGWDVRRYTGSEINADSKACAVDIAHAIERKAWRLQRDQKAYERAIKAQVRRLN